MYMSRLFSLTCGVSRKRTMLPSRAHTPLLRDMISSNPTCTCRAYFWNLGTVFKIMTVWPLTSGSSREWAMFEFWPYLWETGGMMSCTEGGQVSTVQLPSSGGKRSVKGRGQYRAGPVGCSLCNTGAVTCWVDWVHWVAPHRWSIVAARPAPKHMCSCPARSLRSDLANVHICEQTNLHFHYVVFLLALCHCLLHTQTLSPSNTVTHTYTLTHVVIKRWTWQLTQMCSCRSLCVWKRERRW
jgi:hypothetical protein